jgi:hypothetical protein
MGENPSSKAGRINSGKATAYKAKSRMNLQNGWTGMARRPFTSISPLSFLPSIAELFRNNLVGLTSHIITLQCGTETPPLARV